MKKRAFITGITGQDGAHLTKHLLDLDYEVHGLIRRSSSPNIHRISNLMMEKFGDRSIKLHFGDMTDFSSLIRIIGDVKPHEIYNLAAQSHVAVSFETPEYTANADGIGCLRILEAIKLLGLINHTKYYQASTSELYGKVLETPQKETTPFHPRSPYGVAKLYAYWIAVNYREAYGMFACNGILFNHEGELRGELFVTRKITKTVARIANGSNEVLSLGNLDSLRDWGDASEYVKGMHLMLQQEIPEDYVLATGEMHSVREFVESAFAAINRTIVWEGSGVNEIGRCQSTGVKLIEVDAAFFRPAEVDLLLGDPSKAERQLGWKHTKKFDQLVKDMVAADLDRQTRIISSGVTLEDFI
jgi:GDPmannose 4,6-dehydratase